MRKKLRNLVSARKLGHMNPEDFSTSYQEYTKTYNESFKVESGGFCPVRELL
jgi:hypothetical protein